YLESTIERLVSERLHDDEENIRSVWANSYREGMADRIAGKLRQRRREQISEERRKADEAADRAAKATGEGYSTSTAVTLSSVRQQEKDENLDFIYGEGFTAQVAADNARRVAARAAAEAEHAAWAAANPKEAAKQARAEEAR